MSNELAVRNDVSTESPAGKLVNWGMAADAAHGLAVALCRTDFVPTRRVAGNDVKLSVDDATAAIIMGAELGLSPLNSLRSIFIVHGTPALYGRTMLALVLSAGHEVWTVSSAVGKVEVHGRRKGSDKVEESIWTTARATTAKYLGNAKYQTHPQEMLYWKCIAEICRKIGADVLAGIPYSVEELELEEQAGTVTLSLTKTDEKPKVKVSRVKTEKPQMIEPSLDGDSDKPGEDEVDEPAETVEEEHSLDRETVSGDPIETADEGEDPLWPKVVIPNAEVTRASLEADGANFGPGNGGVATAKQVGMLLSLLGKLGMDDKAIALTYMSDLLKREVKSRKAVTTFEASAVIDALLAEQKNGGQK